MLFLYPFGCDQLVDLAVVNRIACTELPYPDNDPDGIVADVARE